MGRPLPLRSQQGSAIRQQGSAILEALLSILIFSMGVLAVVGMQSAAVKAASDAKYRSDANLLANELIGQMWTGNRTGSNLQTIYAGSAGTGGTGYAAWLANVQATLPQATTYPPSVTVNATTGLVTIVVQWKLPSETSAAPVHNYTVVAQVK